MEQEPQQQRPVLPLSTYNESILSSYQEEDDDQSILSSYQEEDDDPKNEYPIIMMNAQAEVSSSPTLQQDSSFVHQPAVLLPPSITMPSVDETATIRKETSPPQSMALIVFHRQQKDKKDENMQQQAVIIKGEEGAAEQEIDQQQHEVAVHEDMDAQEVEYPSTVVSTIVDDRVTALAGIGWEEMVDPSSGHSYYHHLQSGDKQWTDPSLVVEQNGPRSDGTACALPAVSSIGEAEEPLQQEDQQQKGAPPAEGIATIVDAAPIEASMPIGGNDADESGVGGPEEEIGWVECFDQITGQCYYLHPITGERRWSHTYLVPSASLEETAGGANVKQDREPQHINFPAVEQIEAIVVEQSVVAEEAEADVEREEAYLEEETEQQHINVPTIEQIQEIFVIEQPTLAEEAKAEKERGKAVVPPKMEEQDDRYSSDDDWNSPGQEEARRESKEVASERYLVSGREEVEAGQKSEAHPQESFELDSRQQQQQAEEGIGIESQSSLQQPIDQEEAEEKGPSLLLQQQPEEPEPSHKSETSPQEKQQQQANINPQPLMQDSIDQERVEVERPPMIQQPKIPDPSRGSESSQQQQSIAQGSLEVEPQPSLQGSTGQEKREIEALSSVLQQSEEPGQHHGPGSSPQKEQQQEDQQQQHLIVQESMEIESQPLLQESTNQEKVEVESPPMIQQPDEPQPWHRSKASKQQQQQQQQQPPPVIISIEPQPPLEESLHQGKAEIDPPLSSEEPESSHWPESAPQEQQQEGQQDKIKQHQEEELQHPTLAIVDVPLNSEMNKTEELSLHQIAQDHQQPSGTDGMESILESRSAQEQQHSFIHPLSERESVVLEQIQELSPDVANPSSQAEAKERRTTDVIQEPMPLLINGGLTVKKEKEKEEEQMIPEVIMHNQSPEEVQEEEHTSSSISVGEEDEDLERVESEDGEKMNNGFGQDFAEYDQDEEPNPRSPWVELYDPVTGQVYYFNAVFSQSGWDPPASIPPPFTPDMSQTSRQQQQQQQGAHDYSSYLDQPTSCEQTLSLTNRYANQKSYYYDNDDDCSSAPQATAAAANNSYNFYPNAPSAVDEEEGVMNQCIVPPPQSVGGEEGGGQEAKKREESDEDRRRVVAFAENGKEVEVERLKQALEVLEQTVADMMALTGRNGDDADNASVSRLRDLEEAVYGLQTVTRGFLTRTQPTEEASNADMASTMLMRTARGSPDGDSYHAPFQGTMTSSAFLPNKTTAAKRLERLNDLLDFAVAEDHINLFDQTTQGEGDDGKSNEEPGPEDGAAISAAAMERPHLPFQARIEQRSKQLFQSWKHRRRTFEPDQDSEMEEEHELSQTEKKDEEEIDDEDDNLKEAPHLCLTLPDPLQQGISEAKAFYREMLRKVKEKDRAMDKAIDQELHVSDPSMLHEEQEDSIDYKSLHLDSIILGHRHPNYLHLLEPGRGVIFYQNTETGEFCRKMPDKEALRVTQIEKLAGGAIKKPVKSADRPRRPSLALGQRRNNLLSTITLTRDKWIKRKQNHLHAQRRASVAIQSHSSIPQSLAGQDLATSKLSRPPHPPLHPQSSVGKVIAQGLQATFPLADLPATYRRRSSGDRPSSYSLPARRLSSGPPSTSRPVFDPPIRKQGSNGEETLFSASSDEPIADERQSSVRTASSRQQLTEKEEEGLPQQPFRLAGNHKEAIPIFADLFSTIEKKKDETKRRDQVAGRLDGVNSFFEMQKQRLMNNMSLDSNVASIRQRKLLHQAVCGSHSQQKQHHRCQVRFLDIVLAEILSILGRKLDSRRLLRRQDLLDLIRLQAISTPMAQHEASVCEEEQGHNPAGVDVFAKLKDLHILRDDGFWLEMQDTNIEREGSSKIYVRDRNGEPAVQPGVPLRYRLLALLNKGSLKQELGDGWEEHFCREGPLVGETTIYFDKVHHKVTWREPKRLFKHKNRSSSSAAEAKESSASAPQQATAAVLNLGRHRSSLLTRGIVSMLREPNPANQTSLLAVIGFALLALQGNLYHQADAALKKAIALMTGVAGEKIGSSKRSIPTARQQAVTLIASSRVALLNDDFGQAANSCSSAMAMAKDELDIITMAAEIFLHLGLEGEAKQALASGLAKMLREETSSSSSVAFYRLYARYCMGRGCHGSTHIYFKKAIQYGKKKAGNSNSSSNRSSYREVAQACLEYAVFVLESTQYGKSQVPVIKVLEADRLLRQGINLIRTASHSDSNDKGEKGLKRSKSTAELPEHDREQLSDLYYCLGRLYHIYRQHCHSPQHHNKPSHFQCALGYYSQALKLRPDHPLALLYAACLFSLQKPISTSTWMKAAATSSSSSQQKTQRKEEIREADALFRKALIQPEMKSLGYLPSLLYVHFLAIILGDYAQAEEECLRLIVIQQPKGVSALPGIALAGFLFDHVASGGKAAARQLYRRIAELYSNDAVAQVAMGMSLINELSSPLNIEEANSYIDRALRISDGTFVPALRAKALLLSKTKDSTGKGRTKALELFHYGLRLMPTNAPLLRSTAMHLLASMPLTEAQGLQRQVMSLLSKALELEPYHIPTLLACALAKIQCFQDTKGAVDLLMKVITVTKSRPSHQSNTTRHKQYKAHAYRLLGHLYYDSAKNESALSAFSSALRLHEHLEGGQSESYQAMVGYASAMAINALSMNRREQKRPNHHNDKVNEAKNYFKKVFDSDNHSRPLSSYCYILYGAFQMKVYYDLKAAHDLFLSAAKDKRRPANCLALYYLGRIAMAENRLKEIEQWFIWALEVEPMTHLQVMEYVLMMQELQTDFENESRFYEQIKARYLRTSPTGQSTSLYKEVWQRKWELFSKVMAFARLREQYLITKKGLDLSSVRPSTLLMAEVGWETCYARTMFDQPDTWSGMLTAQVASSCEKRKIRMAKEGND